MGSFLGLRTMHSSLEPKTVRTAAFRLLPRTLRTPALKRPKGHGPEERFMGRDHDLDPLTNSSDGTCALAGALAAS